jgi:hypothetical protein
MFSEVNNFNFEKLKFSIFWPSTILAFYCLFSLVKIISPLTLHTDSLERTQAHLVKALKKTFGLLRGVADLGFCYADSRQTGQNNDSKTFEA